MKPFLQSIAEGYSSRYDDMSDFLFIFPNRRSGTFFRKYLGESVRGRVVLAPETTTISDFVVGLSGKVADSRIDLLLTLFDAYRELNPGVSDHDFDSFRSWGEVVLSDFNDVDMHCVDASAIFKNVRDFKSIETDYLTEEQRAVMAEYFGTAAYKESFDRFWKSYDYKGKAVNGRQTEIKERFILLWETLWPLYNRFNELLSQKNLCYPGMAYRLAWNRLRDSGMEDCGYRKLVFVGLNALSKAEWLILDTLRRERTHTAYGDEPLADFVWDDSSPCFRQPSCSGGKFIVKNVRQFRQPEWLDMSGSDASGCFPEINVISSPSNSLQSKIAGSEVARLMDECGEDDFAEAKVAVVLPDENLLIPMLYSLPENVGEANLTMGFPLRLTGASAFVQLLRRLQARKRLSGADWLYPSADVATLMSHPYSMAICGADAIMRLRSYGSRLRKFMLTDKEILGYCPEAATLIYPLGKEAGVPEAAGYLINALEKAAEALSIADKGDVRVKKRLDIDYIEAHIDAVRRLYNAVRDHGTEMKPRTFFSLTDRLLAGETVNFEGEPLEGLQVMGLLETRCLDFEHIVIPSMNERIFPRRFRSRTFIPANIRRAYGMSPAGYDESIFSYYFYRLICRARSVSLIYDSRTGGTQSGDASRYIHQLVHLYGGGHIRNIEYRFGIGRTDAVRPQVPKTHDVLERLGKYLAGEGEKCFSASSLMKYLACPLQFYFEKIAGLMPDSDAQEGLDSIMTGNIVHRALMESYLPVDLRKVYLKEGVLITAEFIDRLLSDVPRLSRIVERNVFVELHPGACVCAEPELTPDMKMAADVLCGQVVNVLRRDRMQTPFLLHGVEFKGTVRLPLSDGRMANMTYTVDRLDRPNPDRLDSTLRIVDYKTGSIHAKAGNLEELCSAAYGAKHLFQLQLYANLLDMTDGTPDRPVGMALYDVAHIMRRKSYGKSDGVVVPEFEGVELRDHLSGGEDVNAGFMASVRTTIEEILDPEVPFAATDKEENCMYCPFRLICGH